MKTGFTILYVVLVFVTTGYSNSPSPVTFLKNEGQWQREVLYQGISTSVNVNFLSDGLSFGQAGEEIENPDGTEEYPYLVWNMKFVEANPGVVVTGSGERESVHSWLRGNDPAKWIIHPVEYNTLTYHSLFQNVDLVFYGKDTQIKYDYIVHSGGVISGIKARYEGVQKLSVNAAGELVVVTPWEVQIQKAPEAWQVIEGKKIPVAMKYKIFDDVSFGFEAPEGYEANYDLIIDPLFTMVWSSYTKATGISNNINYCFGNAMDKEGNVYLTGMVDQTFPITPGAYSGPGGVYPDIFVAKFSSDGTTLLYSTYLPANSSEHGVAIAVDDSGRAYVTGVIDLNITMMTTYPSTANAYQPVHDQGSDAFLTVLNPTGTGLVYSSFLGGTGSEIGYGIALGDPGIAYIAGYTSIGNFPTKATNIFPTGDKDVFVAKFDINQSGNNSLIYSTRIGGGSFVNCYGRGIAVNSAGNAFVTGSIGSSFGSPNYPITPGAYTNVFNTGQDGAMSFVTKLSATTPVTLEYSTYVAPGVATSIAVDAATDDAYITGTTYTFAFPTTAGALQPVHGGVSGTDAFLIRLNSTGSALVYCTFLGGPLYDTGTGVAVNSAGEAYATGIAQDNFPTSVGSFQPANAGSYDFFAVHVNASGTGYGCGGSTYIGGSDADYSGSFYDYSSPRVSIRDHGGVNDTICISSTSHSQDFPTTPGVYGPVKVNGIADQPVFFKLTCFTAAVPVAAFAAPGSICPGTCIDFTNLSQNASSYEWIFQGASVSSSTDMNPMGICYANPGSYLVTLIVTNTNGSDTMMNFVTVYPSPPPQGIQQSGDTLIANQGAVSYQWYYNGGLIPGATNYFHVALQSGDYNVVATDANGCEVEAVIFNVLTQIDATVQQAGWKVFPNPAKDILTVRVWTSEGNPSLSFYNLLGEKVGIAISLKEVEAGDPEKEFKADLSELPSGIFLVEFSDGKNILRKKFCKE